MSQVYFPDGKLGEKKRIIYQAIEEIGTDGGLERKSVLNAMDTYAVEYNLEKTIEAFNNTPMEYYSARKKAKEIALQAAVNIHAGSTSTDDEVLDCAKSFYEWLIAE